MLRIPDLNEASLFMQKISGELAEYRQHPEDNEDKPFAITWDDSEQTLVNLLQVVTFLTKLTEMETSCDALSNTVRDQSETLMNRQKVVEGLEEQLTEFRNENDQLNQRVDDLLETNAELRISPPAPGNKVAPAEVGSLLVNELCDALEAYGLNLAKNGTSDTHAILAASFIKVSYLGRTMAWPDLMKWLKGIQ